MANKTELLGQKAFGTCRVSALVCFVTKKLVKLTKYAKQELNNSNQTIVKSFFASWIVMPTTLSSIKIVAGSKKITAIGAMYNNRFIELSFSLQDIRTEKHSASTQMQSSKWIQGNVYRILNTYKREDKVTPQKTEEFLAILSSTPLLQLLLCTWWSQTDES